MSDPFVGQIALFAFQFAPPGWALCQGQLMPISQNIALFGVIGTNYGGDGRSTFALPNLQGRAPVGAGQGPGLSNYFPGESGGEPAVALQSAAMPPHAHGFVASTDAATATSPQNNLLARAVRPSAPHAEAALAPGAELGAPGPIGVEADFYSANPRNASTALAASSIVAAGENRPHNNMQPYLALNFCIALRGTVPART
jgi:microcystin-dependent protein